MTKPNDQRKRKNQKELAADLPESLTDASGLGWSGGPRPKRNPEAPDWEFWQDFSNVELWQAIALSLNLDPDLIDKYEIEKSGFRLDEDGWNGTHPLSADTTDKFSKRLRRLIENISNRDFFSPNTLSLNSPVFHGVRLDEFSVWCFQKNIEIPLQLLRFGETLQLQRQEKEKKQAGRYTLEEAAKEISENAGERFEDIQRKLVNAARLGQLPVYEPGKNAKYDYGKDAASQVHHYYEEAFWKDLNHWITINEPRISYRFPNPKNLNADEQILDVTCHAAPLNEPQKEVVKAAGETKANILKADWPLSNRFNNDSLTRALSDIPKWLIPALVTRGKAGKQSSTWNPALIASALLDKNYATKSALDRHLKSHFPNHVDEWERINEM